MWLQDSDPQQTITRRRTKRMSSTPVQDLNHGALTDGELLKLVLGNASTRVDSLKELTLATVDELTEKLGVRQALRFQATVELGRRALRASEVRPRLSTPEQIYRYLAPQLCGLRQEVFHVLSFNSRNVLLRDARVAEGTADSCAVDPREVFGSALGARAAAVVLAHNHPSGSPEPSAQDLQLTRQLLQGARVLGTKVLDHIIVGDERFVSMLERGMLA